MSGGALLWVGPVSAANLAGVQLPPGVALYVLNKAPGGIASSAFRAWAAELRTLDGALAAAGAPRFVPVYLAGFSAGGAFVDEILKTSANDPRLRLALGADAYYTMHTDYPQVKDGWLRAGKRARAGGGLTVILTTSAVAGPDYYSASKSTEPLRSALGLRGGAASPPWAHVAGVSPLMFTRNGGAFLIDYGERFGKLQAGHVAQATKVAPAMLSAYFSNRTGTATRRGSSPLLVGGLIALAAALAMRREP